MKILLIAATEAEIAPSTKHIEGVAKADSEGFYHIQKNQIKVLVTGVGMMATACSLTKWLQKNTYDLVIQAGVAGSFDRNIPLGSVVFVAEDRYGDVGAEDKSDFLDVFQMGLADPSQQPFINGSITNNNTTSLKSVVGITVNTVAGNNKTIRERIKRYNPQVETMEGVALHYVCTLEQVNYMQLRGISNFVEERNREAWQLEKAITNMNEWLMQYLTN